MRFVAVAAVADQTCLCSRQRQPVVLVVGSAVSQKLSMREMSCVSTKKCADRRLGQKAAVGQTF